MLAGLFLASASVLLCAGAPNVVLFVAFRFFGGLGAGAILASTAPLTTELSPREERGFVVSFTNSFWTLGLIFTAVAAWAVFGIFDLNWRVYMAITSLPSVCGFVLILWLVPESPRFFALQGDYERAAQSANSIATSLGYRGRLMKPVEIKQHYGHIFYQSSQQFNWKEKMQQAMNKLRLAYAKDLRRSTLTLQALWTLVNIGGSIGTWLNTIFKNLHVQNVYFCFILMNCACIPGNIASIVLTDRIGRNRFFGISTLVAGASLLCVSAIVSSVGDDEDFANRTAAVIICSCFFYAALTGVYSCLYLMASELFPTNLRSTGVALCSTFGRVAGLFATFFNGSLIDRPALLLFLGSCALLLSLLLSILFPLTEMKSKPVADVCHSSENVIEIHTCNKEEASVSGRYHSFDRSIMT
uniref:Major facilitator superfamily (MFS) profile domain-containing protein n=1 Tax=Corethron hystrix TaxID=216773 RepID=A0A6U5DLD7_9STRA|mmetsp:Transcript_1250/g.2532  ORF Transcript_1250/g.2532 Transcript_1250/m.2532 type:complete len:414 (+) Transcript_1250:137-1378(+)